MQPVGMNCHKHRLQQNAHLHACALMQQQVAQPANNADLMTLAFSQQGSSPGVQSSFGT